MRGAPAPNSRDSLGMSQRTLCELTKATENGPTPSGDPIKGIIFGSLVTRTEDATQTSAPMRPSTSLRLSSEAFITGDANGDAQARQGCVCLREADCPTGCS